MKKRYSQEKKSEILARLGSSGLSRAAFCRREGLCYQNVSKWIGRQSRSLTLVEVQREQVSEVCKVTVRLPGHVEVDFNHELSVKDLAGFCREVCGC